MLCRVVHLTSVHHAFDTRIFHKECKSLAAAGCDVTLIAPHDGGDLISDGVKLKAVATPKDRRERMTRTVREVYREALRQDADVYHFHDPELMPVGVMLKLRGKKVIYDVHEDYSVSMAGKKWLPKAMHGPAALGVSLCEASCANRYDRVVAATPKIAEKFDAQRVRLVQNYPWKSELRGESSIPYREREPIAVYVGWISATRGAREMAAAVRLAAKQVDILLKIGGKVRDGADMAGESQGGNGPVEYLGFLDRPQVAELLGQARVGLLILHPTGNYVNSQPTKLFEYMSAGLPVIAPNFPVCRKFVESTGCGLTVDPLDTAAIAEALVWMMRHPIQAEEMGKRGQRAVMETYNWEREAERLVATYAELQSEIERAQTFRGSKVKRAVVES